MKKTWQDYGREWLDTLVVAISVAMAFRAYFYEPFNIPTGSMQPTLWGNHTRAGEDATAFDVWPLSWAKWLATGERHVECVAEASGVAHVRARGDGYADVRVGASAKTFRLPTDACAAIDGRQFRAGETVWKGTVATGDFIFVNRWLWNFRHPRDGEVMIFSTTGIKALVQGTHYIKRMKARPGETYALEHPVAAGPGRSVMPDVVTMGTDEYFACGDNFGNSFDSRYWGPVPGANLRGVGSVVFWPFSGWRRIR